MKSKNMRFLIIIVVGLGIIVRLIYILEIRNSPFFYSPFGDPEVFNTWALQIAKGNIMGNEVFFKAPLYPYVLALFYRLMGNSFFIPRYLNILFDGISIFFLYLIGKRLINQTVGLIAASIASISGILIYFSGEVLGTSLAVLLSLATLYLFLIANDRIWRWFAAGFVLSFLILVRPNFLICIPCIFLYVILRKGALFLKVKISLLFLVGTAILLTATGIRNYVVGKNFVLVNYSGGVNFYIGNNPESDGVSAVLPGYGNDWDEYSIAEIEMKRELMPSEVSRFWLMKGLRFIEKYPNRFVFLLIKKSYLLWNGKEISNNQNIYRYARNSQLIKFLLFIYGSKRFYFSFSSSIIFSLGLTGIFLTFKRRKEFIIPLILVISYGFSVAIFFTSSRYRMPFFAFLIPFSGYSVYWFIEHLKEKRNVMLWFFSFLPFLFLCNFDPYCISMENDALEYYNLGNAYLRKGEIDKAKEYYKQGIEENFYFPRLHLNLGVLYFKEGNLREAENEYLLEIKVNPEDGRTYHNISLLYEREKNVKGAIRFGKKAIEKTPRFVEPYVNVGRLYIKEEKFDSALIYLEKVNRIKKNDGKILSLLGLVNLKLQRYDSAIKHYKNAIGFISGDPFLHYNLAVAYIAMESFEDARNNLLQALSLKKNFAAAHYNLGLIYLKESDQKKAKEHFEKALQIQPDLLDAKKMIEIIK
ncbi:tetratricopeptide repeat protein [candidate division WOR-3 bacterium]|nr:tetratricopeptide repeat protein [candidate division WOR-3 bacterium]